MSQPAVPRNPLPGDETRGFDGEEHHEAHEIHRRLCTGYALVGDEARLAPRGISVKVPPARTALTVIPSAPSSHAAANCLPYSRPRVTVTALAA